jgi:hypothetical protein
MGRFCFSSQLSSEAVQYQFQTKCRKCRLHDTDGTFRKKG